LPFTFGTKRYFGIGVALAVGVGVGVGVGASVAVGVGTADGADESEQALTSSKERRTAVARMPG
jgi:hypothetical protein